MLYRLYRLSDERTQLIQFPDSFIICGSPFQIQTKYQRRKRKKKNGGKAQTHKEYL
jgi:hypothetical protein